MEAVSAEIVRSQLSMGKSYKEISEELQALYPYITRGLSVRSVRRYVKENGLRELANQDVLKAVEESINEVSLVI